MRIISKFKDYYDSAVSYGQDIEFIYKRDQKSFLLDPNKQIKFTKEPKKESLFCVWQHHIRFYSNGDTYYPRRIVLGFCGKLYPMMIIRKEGDGSSFIFSKEEYLAYCQNENIDSNKLVRSSLYRFDRKNDFWDLTSWNYLQKIFLDYKTPIFVYGELKEGNPENHNLEINPELKAYGFQKKLEPAVAFQEIYMYLAGVLGSNEHEIVTISDKDKIKQHGFDPKYGFRKMPENKNG